MDFAKILELLESTAKVLHLDTSLDSIRSQIQAMVATEHRKDNADKGSSSYYDYPWIRDIFGSQESGQVVCAKDGKMSLRTYTKKGDTYTLGEAKPVKLAYIVETKDKVESQVAYIDGKQTFIAEASAPLECSEILDLQEADAKTATAKVTLIQAGKGSSGYYTESALKKAAKDGIFDGVQMFLNHQTKEERLARPEGDVTKLAGVVRKGSVKFVESNGNRPARLVGETDIYPEFSPFIAARKNDIGLSVRVGAENSGKIQEGVPLVENMVYGLSVDYVTKAGAGGKIEELYESFKGTNPGHTNSGNPPQEKPKVNEDQIKAMITAAVTAAVAPLQESLAKKDAQIDRLTETVTSASAAQLVAESLVGCGLSPRGVQRVTKQVLAAVPMTDGKIDTVKLQESVKAAVTEEKAYLQESGIAPRPVVAFLGNNGVKTHDEAGKPLTGDALLQEANKQTDAAINAILGKETK